MRAAKRAARQMEARPRGQRGLRVGWRAARATGVVRAQSLRKRSKTLQMVRLRTPSRWSHRRMGPACRTRGDSSAERAWAPRRKRSAAGARARRTHAAHPPPVRRPAAAPAGVVPVAGDALVGRMSCLRKRTRCPECRSWAAACGAGGGGVSAQAPKWWRPAAREWAPRRRSRAARAARPTRRSSQTSHLRCNPDYLLRL